MARDDPVTKPSVPPRRALGFLMPNRSGENSERPGQGGALPDAHGSLTLTGAAGNRCKGRRS
jgi:hypothetical protein